MLGTPKPKEKTFTPKWPVGQLTILTFIKPASKCPIPIPIPSSIIKTLSIFEIGNPEAGARCPGIWVIGAS